MHFSSSFATLTLELHNLKSRETECIAYLYIVLSANGLHVVARMLQASRGRIGKQKQSRDQLHQTMCEPFAGA